MGNLSDFCKRCGSNRIPCLCHERNLAEVQRANFEAELNSLTADIEAAKHIKTERAAIADALHGLATEFAEQGSVAKASALADIAAKVRAGHYAPTVEGKSDGKQ